VGKRPKFTPFSLEQTTGTGITHRNRHRQHSLGAGTDCNNWNRQLEQSTTTTRTSTGTVTYYIVTTKGTKENCNRNRIQGTGKARMKLLAFISFHR
jgi:hypothetical protein